MTFIATRPIICTRCGELIEPGQEATFAYNKYEHKVCPTEFD